MNMKHELSGHHCSSKDCDSMWEESKEVRYCGAVILYKYKLSGGTLINSNEFIYSQCELSNRNSYACEPWHTITSRLKECVMTPGKNCSSHSRPLRGCSTRSPNDNNAMRRHPPERPPRQSRQTRPSVTWSVGVSTACSAPSQNRIAADRTSVNAVPILRWQTVGRKGKRTD